MNDKKTPMEGKTSFEEALAKAGLSPSDGRYIGRDADRVIAAHQAELDRKVLEARIDELKILRFKSEVTVLGAQYISGRIAEIEGREKRDE